MPLSALDRLKGKLVLVIDDDRLVREGTSGLLDSWGCRVVTAETEQEAGALLDAVAPDLIVSDVHLAEGQSGLAVVAGLRQRFGRQVPALLISGDISREGMLLAERNGLQLLHKPVSPMALRAVLSDLMKVVDRT